MGEGLRSELRAGLTSGEPRTQILAARRSARANDRELVDAMLPLGDSDDAEVRAAAYWAIDQLRVEAAIPRLVEALGDEDFFARSNAGWALVHLGPTVVPAVEVVATRGASADAREMALLVLERVPQAPSPHGAIPSRAVAVARVVAAAHDLNNEVQFLSLAAPAVVEGLAEAADPDLHGAAADLVEATEQLRARADALIAVARGDAPAEGRSRDLALVAAVHELRQTLSIIAGNAEYLCGCPRDLTAAALTTLSQVSRCVQSITALLRHASFGNGDAAAASRAP